MKIDFEFKCDVPWDSMSGTDRRRFCENCQEHVHHLSGMTEKQATAFLEARDYQVCVDLYVDEQDTALFRAKERRFAAQIEAAKRLVAAAAMVTPLLLAGCDKSESACDVSQQAIPSPLNLDGLFAQVTPEAVEPAGLVATPDEISAFLGDGSAAEPVPEGAIATPQEIAAFLAEDDARPGAIARPIVEPAPVVKPVVQPPKVVPPKIRPIRHVRGKMRRPMKPGPKWSLPYE